MLRRNEYLSLLVFFLWVDTYDSFLQSAIHLENFHDLQIRNDSSIFFLETSSDLLSGDLSLQERLACAVESAAAHHVDRDVYLIYITTKIVNKITYYDLKYIQTLRMYKNIKIVQAVLATLVKNTPARDIIDKVEKSVYRTEQYSDIVRAIILQKLGGVYFDSDVMVLKSFDAVGKNFVGAEYRRSIGNGILGFQQGGSGQIFLDEYLKSCSNTYRVDIRAICGPILLTRLIGQLCKNIDTVHIRDKNCSFINVLSTNKFYALTARRWKEFFDSTVTSKVLDETENSYAIHTWNSLSHSTSLLSNIHSAYGFLARKHCPRTYQAMIS